MTEPKKNGSLVSLTKQTMISLGSAIGVLVVLITLTWQARGAFGQIEVAVGKTGAQIAHVQEDIKSLKVEFYKLREVVSGMKVDVAAVKAEIRK
jgi:uncharacterized protein (DUF111 family)